MKNMLVISSLSLALMSGTALAQVSLGTDGDAAVGVDAGVSVGDTNADVGANAELGASGDVNAGDGSATGGAGVTGGATANVDSDGADGSVDADLGADVAADADDDASASGSVNASADADTDEIDAETTAAVNAEVDAVLDTFEDDGAAFFTDDTRAELRSQAEIETAFMQLSAEQQARLRTICGEGEAQVNASGSAGLCVAINEIETQ